MNKYRPHASSIGDAAANVMAALGYLALILFWTFGIVIILPIFFAERKSGLVRFHTMQAALLWVVKTVAGGGIAFESMAAMLTGNMAYITNPWGWEAELPLLVFRLSVEILILACAVVAMASALNWSVWKVPGIGHLALFICSLSTRPTYVGGDRVPVSCLPMWNRKVRRQSEAEMAARNRNEQMLRTMPVQMLNKLKPPEQDQKAEKPKLALDPHELAKRINMAKPEENAEALKADEPEVKKPEMAAAGAADGFNGRHYLLPMELNSRVDMDAEFVKRIEESVYTSSFDRFFNRMKDQGNARKLQKSGGHGLSPEMMDPPQPTGMD